MKKQTRTIGSIVKIELNNGYHTYGRVLSDASFAIYDCRTNIEIQDPEIIVQKPILFIVAVYDSAVKNGRWLKVFNLPLEKELERLPFKYIQDKLDPNKFQIYDNGNIRPASKEECVGLERAAVWEPEHVEERIIDYYEGRNNKWVELFALK
ncbi:immunity 26/phosphotriesterase HocA family protein [Solitalea canadensis]|uniref:Immunity protein 26 n=1 Tax=Solitalea canadensis (strain ATCC 29591 / DSM 3403 / JCM 21819 / LMG 8368 / NBRC 15130 / NCIMB 12057 / USAM 9D) TaxID=929556 RepID=H8KTQ7_SOLCM|nr:immunity 26/phosphotriesterase HocA family protein [Solitalea canadensis]AFD06632.1 hypothetical protein Solca_1559 [Solitalea canadensis DSM 3403]